MNAPARSCRRLVLFLAAVVLGAGGFARADEPADAAAPAVLRPGDALLVRIDHLGGGLPEYREVVDCDGNVELPFVGFLPAAGKSPDALAAEMAAAYATAGLATNAVVHVEYVRHFEPAPDRAKLVRAQDPRQPVPAAAAPAGAPAAP